MDYPWIIHGPPVVLRITSRAVLCASGLLGGRQVDALRSRAQPLEFEVALQHVAPRTTLSVGGFLMELIWLWPKKIRVPSMTHRFLIMFEKHPAIGG